MIGKFLIDSLFASVVPPPHRVDVSLDFFEEGLSSRIFVCLINATHRFAGDCVTVKEKGNDAFYTTNSLISGLFFKKRFITLYFTIVERMTMYRQ